MKLFLTISIFSLISFLSLSTNQDRTVTINDLEWLTGKWQVEEWSIYEEWEMGDGFLKGQSYRTNATDTILLERLRIEKLDGIINYIPTVLKQNGGNPVYFKLNASTSSNIYRFENPEHDFPKVIQYEKISLDSIKVTLEGTSDNKNEFFLLRHG